LKPKPQWQNAITKVEFLTVSGRLQRRLALKHYSSNLFREKNSDLLRDFIKYQIYRINTNVPFKNTRPFWLDPFIK